jgi:hypothetical protein
MSLTILGRDWSDESLWFSTDEGETDATAAELAHARQQVAIHGTTRLGHLLVDESDITALIQADNAPQPLYPLEACRFCDNDATQRIEGDFFCHGHARAFGQAEDDAMEAMR